MKGIKSHDMIWTEKNIKTFWDVIYQMGTVGFADESAGVIINYVRKKTLTNKEKILDYGGGNGNLSKLLLKTYKNSTIYFCDYSSEAVTKAKQNFKNTKNFGDALLIDNLPPETYDLVFFLEVIEHIGEDQIKLTLDTINTVLKKGGILIITTPNNEDIDSKKVLCPQCHCLFHPVQHLRSFNKYSLEKELKQYGFEKILTKSTYFCNLTIKNIIKFIYFKFNKKKAPNLIGIFKKL